MLREMLAFALIAVIGATVAWACFWPAVWLTESAFAGKTHAVVLPVSHLEDLYAAR